MAKKPPKNGPKRPFLPKSAARIFWTKIFRKKNLCCQWRRPWQVVRLNTTGVALTNEATLGPNGCLWAELWQISQLSKKIALFQRFSKNLIFLFYNRAERPTGAKANFYRRIDLKKKRDATHFLYNARGAARCCPMQTQYLLE